VLLRPHLPPPGQDLAHLGDGARAGGLQDRGEPGRRAGEPLEQVERGGQLGLVEGERPALARAVLAVERGQRVAALAGGLMTSSTAARIESRNIIAVSWRWYVRGLKTKTYRRPMMGRDMM
jgi:hypothetical protein